MVGRTAKPTAAQRRRLDAVSMMRCIACRLQGCEQPNKTEVHHLVDKGNRRLSGGHDSVLPLCGWHHRGLLPPRPKMKLARAEEVYGSSLALNKRAFVRRYGTERDLLHVIDMALQSAQVPRGFP